MRQELRQEFEHRRRYEQKNTWRKFIIPAKNKKENINDRIDEILYMDRISSPQVLLTGFGKTDRM